jgi:O-antigen ligase
MSLGKRKNHEYETIAATKKNGAKDYSSVAPTKGNGKRKDERESAAENTFKPKVSATETIETLAEVNYPSVSPIITARPAADEDVSYSDQKKNEKERKKTLKSERLLGADDWIVRNGHSITFVGIFLFTFFVFFRPYELIPGMDFLKSGAFLIAAATILIYIPTQLSAEGSLTILSTEVKCVLALTALALVTMPIARDPALAWETFNDPFVKAVLIFIMMVNVVRTRRRLMILLWLSFTISVYISFTAISLYLRGEFKTEGYRVSIEMLGLFNNPNDLAMHLITMMPIIITLGLATKNILLRFFYFALGVLFLAASLVTFSRGGFLGLIVMSAILIWKLGRAQRLKYTIAGAVGGGLLVLLAPGNYGLRILSIFFPALDPVGSADARREGLITSIIVTIRNPWGIGIGNSVIFGHRNLQTHNAYTQVSSELGVLGLAAYLIFIVSAFRKLGAIEHTQMRANERDWFYYLAIGLQGSLAAFMVTSFFGSVAYIWYVYYLVAYAVAFQRIYHTEKGLTKEIQAESLREKFSVWQTA